MKIKQDNLKEYLLKDVDFAKVYKKVRFDFDRSNLTAHNWEHIFRDICNAIVIGEAEHADMRVVLPAITMHDIGFLYGATGKTHGAVGAEKLREYLAGEELSYSDLELVHIAACIRTHKGSMHDEHPETLEAKVVADADLLEKFGPLGVYQVIRTYTEFNMNLGEILARNDNLILETKTGKLLAEPNRQFTRDFFSRLADAYAEYPKRE
jgi:HD superfamily phosphodiesterase